jgi:hypothetical protein
MSELPVALGVRRAEVIGGSRRRVAARCRHVVSYVAIAELGIPAARVASAPGVSVPTITEGIGRGGCFIDRMGWTVDKLVAQANYPELRCPPAA